MREEKKAAPAAVAGPSDWQIVPAVPTKEMLAAGAYRKARAAWILDDAMSLPSGADTVPPTDEGLHAASHEVTALQWEAMLAAAPTTQVAPQPSVQQVDDFWPVDGNASRKQLIEQIGQMNYQLTALRQDIAGLVSRVKGQAKALRAFQSAAVPVAQGDAWRDLCWQIADALECTPCTADEVLPKVLTIAEEAARWREIRSISGSNIRVVDIETNTSLFLSHADAAIDAARSQAKKGGA